MELDETTTELTSVINGFEVNGLADSILKDLEKLTALNELIHTSSMTMLNA